MQNRKKLLQIYRLLYNHFGPRHWWPAESAFEVMVGAILTQNTAWSNVEKAIKNLKREKMLTLKAMGSSKLSELKIYIRPSGFYNQKAKRLKMFIGFLRELVGVDIKCLKNYDTDFLRKSLLEVSGIGPETADSILLYGLKRPVFVIDAYTKRIFARHGMVPHEGRYDEIQHFFMKNLPKSAKLFNEYHALIVETGKNYCKNKKPLCGICPLKLVKFGKNMVYYSQNS